MTISFKVSKPTIEKLKEFYLDLKREKTPPYAVFQAIDGDTIVTLYESGKIVFQGKDADLASQFWIETEKMQTKNLDVKNSEKKDSKKEEYIDSKIYHSTSIGSDEVGTGDFFGPIVVSAAYVKKEDIPFLEELGVKDSKKITDEKILEIVPKIIRKIDYESIILTNQEYNLEQKKGYNMNKIKAILHNKVLSKLKSKFSYDYIIVDQFAEKYVYFSYLKESPFVVRDITFLTKAESKCLSVACASMISRYIFLKEFSKLSKELDMFLPKGAGTKVDEIGVKIVQKYGLKKLQQISKGNFKNTEKIQNLLKDIS